MFLVALTSSVFAVNPRVSHEEATVLSLMKLLSIPQTPERHVYGKDMKYLQPDSPAVTQYSWKSCGAATDPVEATLILSPDPLPIPGTIMVEGNATLKEDVTAPVKLVLSISKKVLFTWIPIPCIDEVGSCTYDDACAMLAESFPPAEPCPEPFASQNLPCNCPFPAGSYSLPASQIEVDISGIPTWLTSGDYKVHAVASSSGKELACFNVMVSLK